MVKRPILLLLILAWCSPTSATTWYKYRLYLSDKAGSSFSIQHPEAYLSTKAIERKQQQQIAIDERDLPVNADYIRQIAEQGVEIVTTSRWMNTVVVKCNDSLRAEQLTAQLPFVQQAKRVWLQEITDEPHLPRSEFERTRMRFPEENPVQNIYGEGFDQLTLHHGEKLHQLGFCGNGLTIAVIDAGFLNVDRNPAFQHTRILATRDFVVPDSSVYIAHYHGAHVLSTMAAADTGRMVGTAPAAEYVLLRTEDSETEFPIEEDYWAAAVEYADSIGVDIITSSLGYSRFDQGVESYATQDLNGEHAFISQIANFGADKGILMVLSAGNEANGEWGTITFPADSRKGLTVGAIDRERMRSSFSSFGPTADSRVKPDIVGLGSETSIIDAGGRIITSNGTSYSTPIIAGLVACLKQALPKLSNSQLIQLIRNSGSHHPADKELGWGIPNFFNAYSEGKRLEATTR